MHDINPGEKCKQNSLGSSTASCEMTLAGAGDRDLSPVWLRPRHCVLGAVLSWKSPGHVLMVTWTVSAVLPESVFYLRVCFCYWSLLDAGLSLRSIDFFFLLFEGIVCVCLSVCVRITVLFLNGEWTWEHLKNDQHLLSFLSFSYYSIPLSATFKSTRLILQQPPYIRIESGKKYIRKKIKHIFEKNIDKYLQSSKHFTRIIYTPPEKK